MKGRTPARASGGRLPVEVRILVIAGAIASLVALAMFGWGWT